MKESFRDKVVLVTGAAQGIGLATAQEFAGVGARVVLADVLDMDKQVRALTEKGYQADSYRCDVSNEKEVEKMISWIVDKYGSIDCAFNNAGIQTPQRPMAKDIIKRTPEMEEVLVRDIPKGRLGQPHEVAHAVMWLCSPYATFVDGAAISVDGGFTAH